MSSSQPSKSPLRNDAGWAKVLKKKEFLDKLDADGYFFLTSSELKSLSDREPRLMAKHDSTRQRPQALAERKLNIIPVSRSHYLVGQFDLFTSFPENTEAIRYMPFPDGIESLQPGNLTSEAAALNASAISGIFEDFLGAENLHATVAGRMSTGTFDVHLACGEFHIDKAQMEIDAGFESSTVLCLVEAKNKLSDDFNIRQLYFPYRRFQEEVSKPIALVYQVYSNGIFHLYQYEFTDLFRPESIRLAKSARYTLTPSNITLDVIGKLLASVTIEPEPDTPFPQADSFARVINLCEQLQLSSMSVEDITENYDFTARQTNYYTSAAKYLGLATNDKRIWSLTDLGAQVFEEQRNERNIALIKALAKRQVFHDVLTLALKHNKVPDKATIISVMRTYHLGLSVDTTTRRAGTVLSWVQWVWDLATTQELEI